MSNVLVKATGQVLKSRHTPDYMTADYIINPTEQDIIDYQPAFDLSDYKKKRYSEIDANTSNIFSSGYDIGGGIVTSLSLESQSSWHAMNAERDILTYPFEISTTDESGYDVADAVTLNNIYKGGIGYINGIKKAGRTLKKQIKAAVDKAGVDAVVDDRD